MEIIQLKDLHKIAKENSFKFICLDDADGNRIVPVNTPATKLTIEGNINKIKAALNKPINKPGKYKVTFSERQGSNVKQHEYYLIKSAQLSDVHHANHVVIHEPQERIERALSFDKAIELNGELANLRAERLYLLEQIKQLQEMNEELEQEIDKLESEASQLSETPKSTIVDTLKEYAPSIFAYLDKSLQIKEQELSQNKTAPAPVPTQPPAPRKITPGSDEHLRIIELLLNKEDYINLGKQLEKVKAMNEELYYMLLEKYNLTFDENNDKGETEQSY
jgi:hypothetical protein